MAKTTKVKQLKLGKSSFRKNLINDLGFQFGDLTPTAKKRFLSFMKKHKNNVKIEPTGKPGITLTSL